MRVDARGMLLKELEARMVERGIGGTLRVWDNEVEPGLWLAYSYGSGSMRRFFPVSATGDIMSLRSRNAIIGDMFAAMLAWLEGVGGSGLELDR